MLKITSKSVSLTGSITVDNKEVAGCSATIDSKNPANMNFSSWINDSAAYKNNLAKCREDEDEFRKIAREIQDEMLAQ